MARNAAHILTSAETVSANTNRAMLSSRVGQTVTLDFVKRDGTPRILTGEIVGFVGTRKGSASTEAVVLSTEAGERSANLWAIRSIA